MSDASSPGQEIVRSAWEHAEPGGNDRATRVVYAAGFFDGEGWVSIRTHRIGQPALYIGAGQKTIEPLRIPQGLWGGAIHQGKDGMFRWVIQSDRASRALADMLPFLIVKRRQAIIGMDFHANREARPRRYEGARDRAREGTRRYRARRNGVNVATPPRPRLSPEAYERARRYKDMLIGARP